MRRWIGLVMLWLALPGAIGQATEITVAWDQPSTNADGTPLEDLCCYTLYYGIAPGQYTGVRPGLTSTRAVITGLLPGTTYYVAVRAVDKDGNQGLATPELRVLTAGDQAPMVQMNFQPGSATVPVGYQKDIGAAYTTVRGYGWSQSLTDHTRRRKINADPSLDTFVFIDAGTTATWTYKLPNGSYAVSLASGDAQYAQGPHRVSVQGVRVINDVRTAVNEFVTRADIPVTVTTGKLTVTIGGAGAGNTMLNYLIIRP